jgi:hypothetical protein
MYFFRYISVVEISRKRLLDAAAASAAYRTSRQQAARAGGHQVLSGHYFF